MYYPICQVLRTDAYYVVVLSFFNKPVSQPFALQAGARLKFRPPC